MTTTDEVVKLVAQHFKVKRTAVQVSEYDLTHTTSDQRRGERTHEITVRTNATIRLALFGMSPVFESFHGASIDVALKKALEAPVYKNR